MLQKSLEGFLKEFKQAVDEEKTKLNLPDAGSKKLFGGPGYKLPKEPVKAPSLQDKKTSPKKEEADDDFEVLDSVPSTLDLDVHQNEKIVSDFDIVKAFYNIWVNLSYTLVTDREKTVGFLTVSINYKKQLNSELGEAFKLLFSAKLENDSVFFKLFEPFHSVTEAAVLECDSLFKNFKNLKKAGKASFTAIQFVFETIVKLEKSRKLKVALEEQLAPANKLSADDKIKLIRETQVNIFRVFFGQKLSNESEPIFIIKERELNQYIENYSFPNNIGPIITQYQMPAATLDVEASSFLAFSTWSFIVSYTTKLSNTLKQLEDEIINLKKMLDVPVPLPVSNQIKIEEAVELPSSPVNVEENQNALPDLPLKELQLIIEEERKNSEQNPSPDSSWIKLPNKSSELEQNNAQNPIKPFISPTINSPDTSLNESNEWSFLYDEDTQTNQNKTHSEESESELEEIITSPLLPQVPKISDQSGDSLPRLQPQKMFRGEMTDELPEKKLLPNDGSDIDVEIFHSLFTQDPLEEIAGNNEKNNFHAIDTQVTTIQNSADNKIEIRVVDLEEESEKNNIENLSEKTDIPAPPTIKTTQPKIHQEKTSPTISDIALYTVLFILLAALGAGIGFLAGGIGGAMLGGLIGALISETVILYLMDKKPEIDSHIEDQPFITESTESDTDEEDDTSKNALDHNHDKLFTV